MSRKLGLAAALCLLSASALGADRAAIKLGLWEISHTSETEGVPAMPAMPSIPGDVLARMPPEQRARMEAAMKARGSSDAAGRASTIRECLTDEDRDRPFKPDSGDGHCTHTIVSRTATSMEMRMQCKDMAHPGSSSDGTFKWQAPTPESMQGTLEMHLSDGAKTVTHRARITGKWLGADCGTVKPRSKPSH
jgi:hypothetical protein